MSNAKSRIAIIAAEESLRVEFARRAQAQSVETDLYSSLTDFHTRCGSVFYSGLVLDLRTSMKATGQEKHFLKRIEESFPVLKVIFHTKTGRITGVSEELHFEGDAVFQGFIQRKCLTFRPRGVRIQQRQLIHLNLEQWLGWGRRFRTNTLNLSSAGLFIISPKPLAIGEVAKFTLHKFKDASPIEGEVRWTLPWGSTLHHLPGFGVKFTKISESQIAEIDTLTRPWVLKCEPGEPVA